MMETSHDISLVVFGTLFGVAVGAYLPWGKIFRALGLKKKTTRSNGSSDSPDAFLVESARLIGEVCKIDSPINAEEQAAFEKLFFARFPAAETDREEIIFSFEDESLRGRNLAEGVAQLYWDFSSRKDDLKALLKLSIEIAIVDGAKNASEEHILEIIARTFGIHSKDFKKLETEVLEAYYNKAGYSSAAQQSSGTHGHSSRSATSHSGAASQDSDAHSRRQRSEETLRTLSHTKYYRILGLTTTASKSEIKQAYRRLVKENHPDIARNSSLDGGKRFREIQIAYEALQKAKLV